MTKSWICVIFVETVSSNYKGKKVLQLQVLDTSFRKTDKERVLIRTAYLQGNFEEMGVKLRLTSDLVLTWWFKWPFWPWWFIFSSSPPQNQGKRFVSHCQENKRTIITWKCSAMINKYRASHWLPDYDVLHRWTLRKTSVVRSIRTSLFTKWIQTFQLPFSSISILFFELLLIKRKRWHPKWKRELTNPHHCNIAALFTAETVLCFGLLWRHIMVVS